LSLLVRFAFALALSLGLFWPVFADWPPSWFQLVGFSVEFHRSESYLQFFVLDLTTRPTTFAPLGITVLSLYF